MTEDNTMISNRLQYKKAGKQNIQLITKFVANCNCIFHLLYTQVDSLIPYDKQPCNFIKLHKKHTNGYWQGIWIQAPLLLLNQILISIVETKQSKSVKTDDNSSYNVAAVN